MNDVDHFCATVFLPSETYEVYYIEKCLCGKLAATGPCPEPREFCVYRRNMFL
jgi:hypothetical protein